MPANAPVRFAAKQSPKSPRRQGIGSTSRDDRIIESLGQWFTTNARPLPWRDKPHGQRDGYRAMLSEFMLQQTQVSRALEKYPEFLRRFPTIRDLAAASEDEVLAAWSGMGYYRRARLLHGAAKTVVGEFGSEVPRMVEDLLSLPGVGRYTAGAIASMAFGKPVPIVDGNVVRVLLRIEGRDGAADEKATVDWCWDRASELVAPAGNPGLFNESLMELGATVCVPKSPRCEACPLAALCVARREGMQDRIPRPKVAAKRSAVVHSCLIVRDDRGRVLVEQRPGKGMWSRMWQAPTVETIPPVVPPTGASLVSKLVGGKGLNVKKTGEFVHQTTHREVRFVVWECAKVVRGHRPGAGRRWVSMAELEGLGLSNPQAKMLKSPVP